VGEFVAELWAFMKERKKFWLLPIVLVLMLFSVLIVFTQGSVVAPFVYTLF
jgi:competence protein ComGC